MKLPSRIAVMAAALMLLSSLCGCAGSGKSKDNSSAAETASVAESSQPESKEPSVSTPEPSQESITESVTESTAPSGDSSSQPSETESSKASEPAESSAESSDASGDESSYTFDDSQTAKDYHTDKEFTDDEAFNALFAQNDIDKACKSELMELEDITEMRNVTIRYADIWKTEVDDAYQKLYDMLADIPEEQEKLVASQKSWADELDEIEEGFRQEASGGGTNELLAADSAMMNYYRGRAAVLYYQIYLLGGSFDMN